MAPKRNPERRARIAEMLDRGLGLAEIARRLEVTIPTVWHYACGLGYEPDARFNRRHSQTDNFAGRGVVRRLEPAA
jgi:Homeodomain-like domain